MLSVVFSFQLLQQVLSSFSVAATVLLIGHHAVCKGDGGGRAHVGGGLRHVFACFIGFVVTSLAGVAGQCQWRG
jgi:hypothetical protein